tara:strand:+ start:152 stop:952 length:801 start_codon:yes stop_codon:yes gene_type:complete
MNELKITIVCPTYNSEKFIRTTLDKVFNQTFNNYELIICDDGSTDNTINIIEEIFNNNKNVQCKLIRNKHKGPGAARNECIKHATGNWISFLDSDDLWEKNKLEVVVGVINKNKSKNFIFHNEAKIKLNGDKELLHDFAKFYNNDLSLSYQLWKYCIFHTSAITCKLDLLNQYIGFDETLMSSQDWELWLRMSRDIKYVHIPEILGTYIERKNNITNTKSIKGLFDRLKVMTRHWKFSEASIFDLLYMYLRRIFGFIFTELVKRSS